MALRLLDRAALPAAIIAIFGALWAVYELAKALDLIPPDRLSIAAGAPGSAYHAVAQRYRTILARDGITLDILETRGSVENAAALAEGRAEVALLQGGVDPPEEFDAEALAAVFLEPLLVLTRAPLDDPADPALWTGRRVAAGPQGSGTRAAVERMVAALGIETPRDALLPLGGASAGEALQNGEVDVAVFVAPIDAPYLQPLLADPEVRIAPVRDVEALARKLPFVQVVEIPAAGLDYVRRRPPEAVRLPAMVGRLVARDGLHPALVNRLVMAAIEVHSAPDLLTPEGAFPSVAGLLMPVDPLAQSLVSDGPSALDRLLPYWIAAQISRVAVLLVPLVVLALPLLRALPGLYAWQMRARVWRNYDELLEIDRAAEAAPDPETLATLEARLDHIETEARTVSVPLSYRENAYALRLHIDLVRRGIEHRRAVLGARAS